MTAHYTVKILTYFSWNTYLKGGAYRDMPFLSKPLKEKEVCVDPDLELPQGHNALMKFKQTPRCEYGHILILDKPDYEMKFAQGEPGKDRGCIKMHPT